MDCKMNKRGTQCSVIFASEEDAKKALAERAHRIKDQPIECSAYVPAPEDDKEKDQRHGHDHKHRDKKSVVAGVPAAQAEEEKGNERRKRFRLTVARVPFPARERNFLQQSQCAIIAYVRTYFEQFGPVGKIMMHNVNGVFRGSCYVWFDSEAAFNKALAANNFMDGQRLECWVGSMHDAPRRADMPKPVPVAGPMPAALQKPQPVAVPESVVKSSIAASTLVSAGESSVRLAMLEEQLQEYDDMMDTYVCPISYTLMVDPVTAEDGQTYERSNIEAWLAKNNTSPVTRAVLASKKLIPNVKAKQSIGELTEKRNKCAAKIAELKKAQPPHV